MKFIIIIFLVLFSLTTKSQQLISSMTSRKLAGEITNLLRVDAKKSDSLVAIINSSNLQMHSVVIDKKSIKDQKLVSFNEIARQRDIRIAELLSQEQITKLREFMSTKSKKK